MLKKIIPILACPKCNEKTSSLKHISFDDALNARIRNGAVVCQSCGAWFPIVNYVLELIVHKLLDTTTIRLLEETFSAEISAAELSMDDLGGGRADPDAVVDYSEQLAQREHFDWYADHPDADYADYAEMPFLSAVDVVTFDYL